MLADARRSFPQFYLLAEEAEVCALNALVMVQAAFVLAVNTVRPKIDVEAAEALEKSTGHTEILYLQLRDVVMACPVMGVPRRAISGGFRRDKFGSGRVDSGGVAQSVMWLES